MINEMEELETEKLYDTEEPFTCISAKVLLGNYILILPLDKEVQICNGIQCTYNSDSWYKPDKIKYALPDNKPYVDNVSELVPVYLIGSRTIPITDITFTPCYEVYKCSRYGTITDCIVTSKRNLIQKRHR